MKPVLPAASVIAEPLLEREAEIERLLAAVAGLRSSPCSGACVLVRGEAGVGKTSLLRCLRERAGDDVQWLWGRCEPMACAPPLAPLIELLDALPVALAAAVRAGRANAEVLAGMLALLRDRARPLVLVIDDAQWADGATLDLLGYVGRRIESVRALLVIIHRDDDLAADHPLRTVLAHLPRQATDRLALAPLSQAAVTELARRAGRDPHGVFRATQGNPFFVTELLASDAGTLPAAVHDAVLARASRLTPTARDVLDLAAMAPNGLAPALLDSLIELSAEGIDECLRAGLLLHESDVLRFRHELARASIEAACGPQRACALHAALLDVLTQQGAANACLVHHAERAGLAGAVLRLAPLAARDASAVSAHRQAADLLALAVREAAALTPPLRAALLVTYAEACAACYRLDQALRSRRRALALHIELRDRLAQGRDLREIARLEWFQGHIEAAVGHATEAIALLDEPGAERDLALACATMAQLHQQDESPLASADWARRALVSFECMNDAEGQAYALNTIGFAELLAGGGATSWARLERSLAMAREHDLDEHVARAYSNLASAAVLHRRFDALRVWCDEGLVYCQACDKDMTAAILIVRAAYACMERGEWQAALAELDRLSTLATLTPKEQEQALHVRALVALRRGDGSHDTYWTEMLDGRRRLSVDPWYAPQAVARAEAAWLRDDRDAVARIAADALPAARRAGECWRIGQLACWLARAGGVPLDLDAPVSPPCALELAGDARGAALAWAALGCRYDQALALLTGDADDQRAAVALLDELGATPAARIGRRRLRERGGGTVGRGPNRHARSDPQGLTSREREVLALLREGLSNAAIAARWHRSERTVENHVAALLRKLGVTSRAAFLARAGAD